MREPCALEAAAALGAHRATAAQYQRVVRFADGRPVAERALPSELRGRVRDYRQPGGGDQSLSASDPALAGNETRSPRRRDARRSPGLSFAAPTMPTPASNSAGDRRALERLAPTKQLTSAYRVKTHLRMLDRDRDAAVKWGKAQFNQWMDGRSRIDAGALGCASALGFSGWQAPPRASPPSCQPSSWSHSRWQISWLLRISVAFL